MQTQLSEFTLKDKKRKWTEEIEIMKEKVIESDKEALKFAIRFDEICENHPLLSGEYFQEKYPLDILLHMLRYLYSFQILPHPFVLPY